MKNTLINQSLIELEENLKNLESARTQVDKVSKKSERVISTFTKVLASVKALIQEFELEKSGFSNTINENLENFNRQLTAGHKAIATKTKELNLDFSTVVNDSIKRLYEFQKQVDVQRDNYTFIIGKNIENFNQNLLNSSKDFNNKASELSTHFFDMISETGDKLKALEGHIDDASNRILSVDFEKNFNDIKSELEALRKEILLGKEQNNQLQSSLKESINKRFQETEKNITELKGILNGQVQSTNLLRQETQQTTTLILNKIEEVKKEQKRSSIFNLIVFIIGIIIVLSTLFILK